MNDDADHPGYATEYTPDLPTHRQPMPADRPSAHASDVHFDPTWDYSEAHANIHRNQHTPRMPPTPWGPWATIGWTLVTSLLGIAIAMGTGMVVGIVMVAAMMNSQTNVHPMVALEPHMTLIGLIANIPMTIAMLMFLWLPIYLRQFKYAQYVGLVRCSWRSMTASTVLVALFMIGEELALMFAEHPPSDWMIEVWMPLASRPILIFTVVVVAPLSEEIFFRGFIYRGLENTRLGPVLPIVFTSIVWAALHVQYSLFIIGLIFLTGILFGWVRHRTGSIWPTIWMHFIMNTAAILTMAWTY